MYIYIYCEFASSHVSHLWSNQHCVVCKDLFRLERKIKCPLVAEPGIAGLPQFSKRVAWLASRWGPDSSHGVCRAFRFSYFSGDNEDALEYRRWRAWVTNKLLTLGKLPKSATDAFVFTLLTGKALECVEHLEPSSYQVEGGDKVLLALLAKDSPTRTGRMSLVRC